MKKIFALIFTLTLVFSLTTIPAFAATIDSAAGSDSHDVKATYYAGDSTKTVYSVTITWGAMDFVYNDGAWDPENHTYDANWTATGNTVTVSNHSNAAVTAKLTYNAAENYTGITGTFSNDTLGLPTAVGTDVNSAPTATATLTLSGALDSNTTANTTIGKVTVTLD